MSRIHHPALPQASERAFARYSDRPSRIARAFGIGVVALGLLATLRTTPAGPVAESAAATAAGPSAAASSQPTQLVVAGYRLVRVPDAQPCERPATASTDNLNDAEATL